MPGEKDLREVGLNPREMLTSHLSEILHSLIFLVFFKLGDVRLK